MSMECESLPQLSEALGPRSGLSSTIIGRGLVVGYGWNDSPCNDVLNVSLDSSAIQNITSPLFSSVAPRAWATLCGTNAQVVIFGGLHSMQTLADCHVVDLDSQRTITVHSVGPCARQGHAACIAGDAMFVFGGNSGVGLLADLWSLNLSTLRWSCLTTDSSSGGPSARFGHCLVSLGGNRLLLFGGYGTAFNCDAWMYHIDTNVWQSLGDCDLTARGWASLTPLFTLTSEEISSLPSTASAAAAAAAAGVDSHAAVSDITVFAVCGGAGDADTWLGDIHLLWVDSHNIVQTRCLSSSLIAAREAHTAAAILSSDGSVIDLFICGGNNGNERLADSACVLHIPRELVISTMKTIPRVEAAEAAVSVAAEELVQDTLADLSQELALLRSPAVGSRSQHVDLLSADVNASVADTERSVSMQLFDAEESLKLAQSALSDKIETQRQLLRKIAQLEQQLSTATTEKHHLQAELTLATSELTSLQDAHSFAQQKLRRLEEEVRALRTENEQMTRTVAMEQAARRLADQRTDDLTVRLRDLESVRAVMEDRLAELLRRCGLPVSDKLPRPFGSMQTVSTAATVASSSPVKTLSLETASTEQLSALAVGQSSLSLGSQTAAETSDNTTTTAAAVASTTDVAASETVDIADVVSVAPAEEALPADSTTLNQAAVSSHVMVEGEAAVSSPHDQPVETVDVPTEASMQIAEAAFVEVASVVTPVTNMQSTPAVYYGDTVSTVLYREMIDKYERERNARATAEARLQDTLEDLAVKQKSMMELQSAVAMLQDLVSAANAARERAEASAGMVKDLVKAQVEREMTPLRLELESTKQSADTASLINQQLRSEIITLQNGLAGLQSAKERAVAQLIKERDNALQTTKATHQLARELRNRLSDQEHIAASAMADAARWKQAAETANATKEIEEFKRTIARMQNEMDEMFASLQEERSGRHTAENDLQNLLQQLERSEYKSLVMRSSRGRASATAARSSPRSPSVGKSSPVAGSPRRPSTGGSKGIILDRRFDTIM